MDCTHCEPVLLDLCYGELEPAQEREARAHVHECPACRKALSRIEAGQALARHLPDETPSPELTDRILRAAQSHLRKRGTPFERFQGFLESMARIAMTRQVAMATMSLLIVFVGLWSIPELTRRRESRGEVLVEAPQGEAGPSAPQPAATAASPHAPESPAQPVELAEKPVPRKRAAADEADSLRMRRSTEVTAKRSAAERRDSAAANAVATRQKAKSERKGDRFAPPPPAAAPAADSVDDLLANDLAQGYNRAPVDGRSRSGRVAARTPESAAAEAEPLAGLSAVEETAAAPRGAVPAPSAAAAAPQTSAAPSTLEDVYAAGVERYRAEDYAAAAKLFSRMLESSSPSAQRPAALLYLARSERSLGRCDRAIRAYETLVRSYGSAQQSAVALSEGVACFDQLGDKAGAQRLLEHASSVPSLSAQATKALHERATSKPAELPGAAAPPSRR